MCMYVINNTMTNEYFNLQNAANKNYLIINVTLS